MITAIRYHDFSAGHRVVGHEGKCVNLHGHNFRIHFEVTAINLDNVGRVLDFSVIKSHLCQWLEDNWDHQFLMWEDDPWLDSLKMVGASGDVYSGTTIIKKKGNGLQLVPFNPTAERMAEYLVKVVGPQQLVDTGTELVRVTVEETRKCSAIYDKRIKHHGH